MNKLFDLRFVIGSFFSIVAVILLIDGFIFSAGRGAGINRWCGALFLVFGVFMVLLSLRKLRSDNEPG